MEGATSLPGTCQILDFGKFLVVVELISILGEQTVVRVHADQGTYFVNQSVNDMTVGMAVSDTNTGARRSPPSSGARPPTPPRTMRTLLWTRRG